MLVKPATPPPVIPESFCPGSSGVANKNLLAFAGYCDTIFQNLFIWRSRGLVVPSSTTLRPPKSRQLKAVLKNHLFFHKSGALTDDSCQTAFVLWAVAHGRYAPQRKNVYEREPECTKGSVHGRYAPKERTRLYDLQRYKFRRVGV